MPTSKENNNRGADFGENIHYSYIIIAIVFFVCGVATVLFFRNYISDEKISFSTVDIINFIFSIGLSTASIVLAVVAITLSKKSEQTIISRNDEGIRYQNEIFNKTIGVLSKIETSTGISEKRIEDIAQEIKAIEKRKPGVESKNDQVKDVIRRALQVHPEETILKTRKQGIDRQEEFTKDIMGNIKDIKDVEVVKIGCGDFDKLGEDMVDGVFTFRGKRYSVSTFFSSGQAKIINFADADTYKQYFLNLAFELTKSTFEKTFLVFNKKTDEDIEFTSLFMNTVSALNQKIVKKIVLASGSSEEINRTIRKEIGAH